MASLIVTPLRDLAATLARVRPTHLVSMLSASHMIETPAGIGHHLKLCFSDVTAPQGEQIPPNADHIARLIDFAQTWDGQAPMVVHCWAGVSRSMAGAFIALCARTPPGIEGRLAKKIRETAAHANPNRLMIRLADRQLNREGRMIDAVESMGRARFVEFGVPVEFSPDGPDGPDGYA